MEQPKFPVALVALVAAFGFLAIWVEPIWMKILAAIGTLVIAAAAIYQSMPQRTPEDPIDDELPPE